jgi:hypothetical protein
METKKRTNKKSCIRRTMEEANFHQLRKKKWKLKLENLTFHQAGSGEW